MVAADGTAVAINRDAQATLLRVWMLGDFRVQVGDRSIAGDEWRLRKAATVVKLLALAHGHRLHREQIVELLWPELDLKAAINNLYHTLHVARRILALPEDAGGTLRIRDETVALAAPEQLWTDVEAFQDAAVEARRLQTSAAFRRAVELYAGDLLPNDIYEDWAAARREGLRSLFLSLLLEMASLYRERSDPGRAIETFQRVVREDPVHEDAHLALMRLHAQAGQRHQALRQYELLCQTLDRELDAEPSEHAQRLHQEILRGDSAQAADKRMAPSPGRPLAGTGHPPAARSGVATESTPVRRHNLPHALTSFIGRESDIGDILRLLEGTRLLTLTGPGGVGKTRLALHVVGSLVETYPDGIWLVQLASLSDPDLVPHTVASVVGVEAKMGRAVIDRLVDSLRGREMLLVLDNCEHLADACAGLSEALLRACPRLQILATSREPLSIAGEMVVITAPLSIPVDGVLPTPESLVDCEAVRLFVERARYRQPTFELVLGNASAVVRLCRYLDGIPLAIELAAARIGTISIDQIVARMGDSLSLLNSGSRTAAPRQQTLRGAMDWSYDLLAKDERTLFRRLSVFVGGWTLEDAEHICASLRSNALDALDVLDLLSKLVDKSLVAAGGELDGSIRYRMLEPIRQYASHRLAETGEAEEMRQRHASLFLGLSERAEPQLMGPDQGIWLHRLEVDHGNLRAALRRAVDLGQTEVGLRIAGALWRFWFTRGHLYEGRRWLNELFDAEAAATGRRLLPAPAGESKSPLPSGHPVPEDVLAKALNAAGALAYYQSDFPQAMAAYEASLSLRRKLNDKKGIAASLGNLGLVVKEDGEYARAEALYEESRSLYDELDDKRGVANALNNLGIVAGAQGKFERAIVLHERSLALKRELGDKRGVVTSLTNLGSIAVERREYQRARELHGESIVLAKELGAKRSLAVAVSNLGHAAWDEGDLPGAVRYFRECLTLVRDVGDAGLVIGALIGLAQVFVSGGDTASACRLLGGCLSHA
jgi:predicted ATPase/DNA-binding SARP family transcriptional activator